MYGSQSKWIEIEGYPLDYNIFENKVNQLSIVDNISEIQEDMELMKDMLSDIEDFEDVGVHIKSWVDYIDIFINKDDWYKGYTFKLTENIHRIINRFRKYFESLGYSIQIYRTNWVISDGNSNHERLWISDDDFLDDDHKVINNKIVTRIQIKLT